MSDPNAPGEPIEPTEPLPGEPPEELIITPMSDPDVPPGEPTMILPIVPGAVPPVEPTSAMPAAYAATQAPPPPPPWFKEHWWVVALVALALAALIIFIIWLTNDDGDDALETSQTTVATSSLPSSTAPSSTAPATTTPATTEPATTEPATTAPATTEATTTTEAATTTTTEPATTTTEAATTTTTAAPTTTLPPPVNGSGSGNRIVPVANPGDGLGVATFSHDGASNFAVQALDANAQPIGVPIIERVGAYQGTVVVPSGTAAFNITADGAWQFVDNAPGAARPFDGRNDQGAGDDVMFYDGDPANARITFDGDGPFVVRSFANNGAVDELVNQDPGPYDNSVGFPGPALVAVTGAGNWTISLR
jgi:hypothetical protein